jgi:hypothetical protein
MHAREDRRRGDREVVFGAAARSIPQAHIATPKTAHVRGAAPLPLEASQ